MFCLGQKSFCAVQKIFHSGQKNFYPGRWTGQKLDSKKIVKYVISIMKKMGFFQSL